MFAAIGHGILKTVAGPVVGVAKTVIGGIVGAAASGVMDQMTSWMTDAAKAIDGFVMHVALATTTPEFGAGWFGDLFQYVTSFALPLAALFAVAAIGAAAMMHNGRMLGQAVYGIVRAGWGTTVALALVILATAAASGVTSDIAAHVPQAFFQGLSDGWGGSGFGGLVASALAFLVALITVIAGIILWIELLFRMAALYVAVAVLPLVLAAAIYPPLSGMLAKMLRFLVVMLIFPAIAELVLLVGAAVVGGGTALSGGVAASASTLVAGAMIYVLAATSPWATLKLVGIEGSMSSGGAGAGAAGAGAALGGAAGGAGAALGGAAGGAAVILAGAQSMAAQTSARMDAAHGGHGQASSASKPSLAAGGQDGVVMPHPTPAPTEAT